MRVVEQKKKKWKESEEEWALVVEGESEEEWALVVEGESEEEWALVVEGESEGEELVGV